MGTGEGLLTEQDLCNLLDLSRYTVVRWIDNGRIPGRRVGDEGRVRTLTSVAQLIEYAEGKWKPE